MCKMQLQKDTRDSAVSEILCLLEKMSSCVHRRGAAGVGSNTLSPKKHWEVLEEWGLEGTRAAHLSHTKRHSPSTAAAHSALIASFTAWKLGRTVCLHSLSPRLFHSCFLSLFPCAFLTHALIHARSLIRVFLAVFLAPSPFRGCEHYP